MNRRDSILTLGMLFASLPLALYSKDDGSFVIESDKEETRFRIGKDAFLLRAKSKIQVEHDGNFTTALTLLGGGVMGVFGGGEKIIKTKTFTAGIRGTGLYLEEYGNDDVYSCLCYGKGDYKHNATGEILLTLDSSYHDKPINILQSSNGKLEYKLSNMDNHSDEELIILEKMCGRDVPFSGMLKSKNMPTQPYKR